MTKKTCKTALLLRKFDTTMAPHPTVPCSAFPAMSVPDGVSA